MFDFEEYDMIIELRYMLVFGFDSYRSRIEFNTDYPKGLNIF